MEVKTDPRAYPMAKDALTTKILNLVSQPTHYILTRIMVYKERL